MKILAIRGKNLASLVGEFDVDFRREPLASAGLFAICGPTGAGKSTLLDALCLALYDNTPRLAKAPSRGIGLPDVGEDTVSPGNPSTLLRRGMGEGYAEVEFVGNDGLEYRARWDVQRGGRKAGGRLKPADMSLTRLSDSQPIGGTKTEVKVEIEARLGLSFPQFTRAVLLAQNDFAAFLKAGDDERAALLETLTGTDIYTVISQKTHERDKEEQGRLKNLHLRLEGQKPLDDAARTALEAERDAAKAATALLEAEKERVEQQLRWHESYAMACQAKRDAQGDLEKAIARWDEAESRRRRLARIDAVQPAAAKLADFERTVQEVRESLTAVALDEEERVRMERERQAAETALEEARQGVAKVQDEQRNVAPDLDRAKALDVEIAGIGRSHAERSRELAEAQRTWRESEQRLDEQRKERSGQASKRQTAIEWLEQQADLKTLAEAWPRWDILFRQAEAAMREVAEAQRKRIEADLATCRTAQEWAIAGRAEAETAFNTAEAAYIEAGRACAAFDGQGLATERREAEARRDGLASAERAWRGLTQIRKQRAELQAKAQILEETLRTAELSLREITVLKPTAEAVWKQAERSLDAARLACAENVEQLRENLESGQPCPVCGAAEHPYALKHPGLRSVMEVLSRQVEEHRQEVETLARRETEQRTTLEFARQQRKDIEPTLELATAECGRLEAAWRNDPLAPDVDEEELLDGFTVQLSAVEERLKAIAAREEAGRKAAEARDAAQKHREAAREKFHEAQRRESAAKSTFDRAADAVASLEEMLKNAVRRRDDRLGELNAALPEPGWREVWQRDPAGFHAAQWQRVEAYQARQALVAALDQRIGVLDAEIKAQSSAAEHMAEQLRRIEDLFRQVDGQLREKRGERGHLFGGRAVAEVESALQKAMADAQNAVRQSETKAAEARSSHAGAEARLGEARKRLGERRIAADRAAAALADWLAEYNAREPSEPPLDIAGLTKLLAHDAAWVAGERRELQSLDNAMRNARSVLDDRRARREEIERQRPTEEPVDALRPRKEALANELKAANDLWGELEWRVRGDDERRARTAELRAEFERQEAIVRLWGQLNLLIGSHDGKKFRNYAQQLTLDVLLGYANHHLANLSRRYRLERVPDKLALMVVDRDMGDEIRSVHSLSGGESFLVSLALALGLASLSSNRVRVESLFIDEGFGSLDTETLRIAMDALDCLHAQGRKVGVISHVQEMTERIGTRIQVKRLSGGQSKVVVAG